MKQPTIIRSGWIMAGNTRICLWNVRKYKHVTTEKCVIVYFQDGTFDRFNFDRKESAEEFMIALDQHFCVGENDSTIELKP